MRLNGYVTGFGALLVIAVGALDYATGADFSFSLFYLLPIASTTWFAGRACGLSVAAFAAATWITADLLSNHQYAHATAPYWNAFVRLGLFGVIVLLLSALRDLQKTMERTVQEKTRLLTAEISGRAHVQQLVGNVRAAEHRRATNELHEEVCQMLKDLSVRAKTLQESCEASAANGGGNGSPEVSCRAQAAQLVHLLNQAVDQSQRLSNELTAPRTEPPAAHVGSLAGNGAEGSPSELPHRAAAGFDPSHAIRKP